MDIWYRQDTGREYLYSRLQAQETNIKVAPLDPEINGEDPTMPSKGFGADAKWGDITGDINNQQDLIDELNKLKEEIEKAIAGEASTIFIYKGQVPTLADLPTDAQPGDVYDVADTGANYAWNGTTWDKLSETYDLSGYVKIETLDLYYLKDEVDRLLQEELKDVVKYQEFTYQDQVRKTIRLDNYDTISSKDSKGSAHNLLMLSKYDVVEMGAPKLHTNISTSQIVTVNDTQAVATDALLERLILPSENVTVTKQQLTDPATGFAFNAYQLNTQGLATEKALNQVEDKVTESLTTQDGNLQALLLKMQELESKLNDTKSLDPEVVVLYEGGDTAFENKEKDFQLSGTVAAPTTIKGNTITLKDATLAATTMSFLAAQDVTISNTAVTGLIPKKISNSLIQIHADGYVALRDCTIDPESAYNGIEIGLSNGLAKSVTIENVDFSGHFVNNAINVFGMQDNGVVTVANCHFTDVSNVFRLSNRTNAKYTLNIINCTFDKWETGEYSGMILLQDYTSTSAEQANEDNQFAKLTINIQNCTGPNGKITPVDLATVCGTQKDDQLIYMWDSYRKHTAYGDKYPTITII